jgi:hypothetical protein
VPALFRSKQPDDEQTARRQTASAPEADVPPLWTGIPEGAPKVDLPDANNAGKSGPRAEGSSKPTGGLAGKSAAKSADTGPTEKTPDVSVWPDPNRSTLPEQRRPPLDAFSPDQAPAAPRMAGLPERHHRDAAWPASGDGSAAGAAGAGQMTGQSNRPAALSGQPGNIDQTATSGSQITANRPAAGGDVPWYEPWYPPQAQQPAEPQYQARHQQPQAEPVQQQLQYQQSGYEQSQPRQPQYQQAQYQQPPYREQPQYQHTPYRETEYRSSEYQHGAQRPVDYSQYSRWGSQPTSYQAPSGQASPPAQNWPPQSMPPQNVPAQSVPPQNGPPAQQLSPQYWQQPEQYQWDYTPDYRRAVVPGRTSPTGQLPDAQRQPPYGPQSYVPQSGAPQTYARPYAQQDYRQQLDERQSYGAQSYVPRQYDDRAGGYSVGRTQPSAALVDRTMPTPPNEPSVGATRYTSASVPAGPPQAERYDGQGMIAGGETRLGTSTDSIPARASYERAGPGTY